MQGSANYFLKGRIVNILAFADQMVSNLAAVAWKLCKQIGVAMFQ